MIVGIQKEGVFRSGMTGASRLNPGENGRNNGGKKRHRRVKRDGEGLAQFELYVVLLDDFHHAWRWQLVGKQIVDQVHVTEVDHRVTAEF